jgi:hypothetical protein
MVQWIGMSSAPTDVLILKGGVNLTQDQMKEVRGPEYQRQEG